VTVVKKGKIKMSTVLSKKANNRGYKQLKVDDEKLMSKALIAPVDENGNTVLDPENEKHRAWFDLFKL
jgi:hypothetical protein